MKKQISVIIPAYNEEDVLDELHRRLKNLMDSNSEYEFEVIIVENGSVDSSFDKMIVLKFESCLALINSTNPAFGYILL